jgi:hypothetical protein
MHCRPAWHSCTTARLRQRCSCPHVCRTPQAIHSPAQDRPRPCSTKNSPGSPRKGWSLFTSPTASRLNSSVNSGRVVIRAPRSLRSLSEVSTTTEKGHSAPPSRAWNQTTPRRIKPSHTGLITDPPESGGTPRRHWRAATSLRENSAQCRTRCREIPNHLVAPIQPLSDPLAVHVLQALRIFVTLARVIIVGGLLRAPTRDVVG